MSVATSGPFVPTAPGTWCFSAVYGGSAYFDAVAQNTDAANLDANDCVLVTPAPATPVGSFASSKGTATTTLAVTPQTVGDVLVVYAEVDATGHTVSSVTGGGVSTWAQGAQFSGANGTDEEIWFGTVATAGASIITFTWSSSISSDSAEYGAQEFSAGLGASTVWALDGSGGTNGISSTTVPLPSLTPSTSDELYFGYGEVANTAAAGSTSGFTFTVSNGNIVAYDPGVSGPVTPEATRVSRRDVRRRGCPPHRLVRHAAARPHRDWRQSEPKCRRHLGDDHRNGLHRDHRG